MMQCDIKPVDASWRINLSREQQGSGIKVQEHPKQPENVGMYVSQYYGTGIENYLAFGDIMFIRQNIC